jgi:hypothetical protein
VSRTWLTFASVYKDDNVKDNWGYKRSIRADLGKPFRPSSAFDEAIVLSPIAADSVGGIIWGASRVPRRCADPQGTRSGASEARSVIRQSLVSF